MPRKTLTGTVVSDKTDKTISVRVSRKQKHPTYGKVVGFSKKFLAHDEENSAKEGDRVTIEESRPFSKRKTWVLKQIVERAA
jgi:small subunit ribosomal protein S17